MIRSVTYQLHRLLQGFQFQNKSKLRISEFNESERMQALFLWTETGKAEELAKLVRKWKTVIACVDDLSRTALHVACNIASLPVVRVLLETKIDVNAQDKSGWSALHYSCRCTSDSSDIIKLLLKRSDIKGIGMIAEFLEHFFFLNVQFGLNFCCLFTPQKPTVNLPNKRKNKKKI